MTTKYSSDTANSQLVAHEPLSATRGGINIALIMTLVLSVAFIAFAVFGMKNNPAAQDSNPLQTAPRVDSAAIPNGTLGPNEKVQQPADNSDKSYVGGQPVSGDTIMSPPYKQH